MMAGANTGFRLKTAPRFAAVGIVAIYRAAVSPVIHAINGPACRFEPSCSVYARDAVAEYGVVRGGIMAIWRVARCNPIGGHGFDPVAPRSMPANLTPNPFPRGKGNNRGKRNQIGF